MKSLFRYLICALTLSFANSTWAGATYLKATVTGTVQTEIILSAENGRIHTEKLNNQRIFQEFQVSPDDYQLVVNVDGNEGLLLMPKSSSGVLQKIPVTGLTTPVSLVNTKARVFKISAGIAPGTATNLFKDVAGEVSGTILYEGTLVQPAYKKSVLSVAARGTDTGGGGNGSALLKFKAVAQGRFVQQP